MRRPLDKARTISSLPVIEHMDPAALALVAFGLILIVGGRLLASRSQSSDAHKRGARLIPKRRSRAPVRLPRRYCDAPPLKLAGVPVAALDETKHFKLIGTTGTGKSTAIRELLHGALERGDRAVVTDPDGGYLARFYNRYRGDVILNPFEPIPSGGICSQRFNTRTMSSSSQAASFPPQTTHQAVSGAAMPALS
jgi:hypothetical protein